MEQYQNLVYRVLSNGNYKQNRTSADTISDFHESYTIDVSDGFPLLTTKQMSSFRWNSLIHELLWYFSGEHHINTLRQKTKIWNAWSDDDWNLPSAYGRFWRRYPVPSSSHQLPGEAWADTDCPWVNKEVPFVVTYDADLETALERFTEESPTDVTLTGCDEYKHREGTVIRATANEDFDADAFSGDVDPRLTESSNLVFDQLGYVIDTLSGENPDRSPHSRRLIVNAWHPANADISNLPPCHFTYVFNVQDGDTLNLHLTQRSGDIALGIPFNIAAYALLLKLIAQHTGYKVGKFGHTIVDAHVYSGKGDRGGWYGENLPTVQEKIAETNSYTDVADWIDETAPAEDTAGYDHVPNLLRQLDRDPLSRPTVEIADKPIDELEFDDFTLSDYESHGALDFEVAE